MNTTAAASDDSATTPTVIIYTDGGCLGNPGPGGWAAILRYGRHTKELSGRASQTTNNRMELRAAIEALNTLNRPCRVEIYTDSEYLRRGITEWVKGWQRNGWKRNSLKEGDVVTVSGSQARDGSKLAIAQTIVFPDGRRLNFLSAYEDFK